MRAVKLCTNKILQFLSGDAGYRKTVVASQQDMEVLYTFIEGKTFY